MRGKLLHNYTFPKDQPQRAPEGNSGFGSRLCDLGHFSLDLVSSFWRVRLGEPPGEM